MQKRKRWGVSSGEVRQPSCAGSAAIYRFVDGKIKDDWEFRYAYQLGADWQGSG
jgi:hypothetical protein